MKTLRLRVAALLAAVTVVAVVAAAASAAPVAKRVAMVDCQGASVTLIMHPGEGGTAVWDISYADVRNAPSYLIKSIEAQVFVSGQLAGTLDVSLGNKTGFGEPLSCAFEVHEGGVDVYGSLQLVQVAQPKAES
jgi:hypothetical protein